MSIAAQPTTAPTTTEQSTMDSGSKEEASNNGCQDVGCKETDIGCQDALCDFWSSWDEELQKVGKLLFPPSSPISSSHKPPRSLVSSHHSQLISGTTICASGDYDDIITIGDPDISSPNTTLAATATVTDTATSAATTTTAMTVGDSTSSGLCVSDPSKVLTPIFDPTFIKQGMYKLEQLKKQSAINEKFDQAAIVKTSLDSVYARLDELKRCEKSMRGAALIAEDYALAKRLQLERDIKREQVMRVLHEALKRWHEKFSCKE